MFLVQNLSLNLASRQAILVLPISINMPTDLDKNTSSKNKNPNCGKSKTEGMFMFPLSIRFLNIYMLLRVDDDTTSFNRLVKSIIINNHFDTKLILFPYLDAEFIHVITTYQITINR